MRRLALAALAWLGALSPVQAEQPARVRETPDQVARRYQLAGELLVAKGDTVLLDKAYGTIAPTGGAPHRPGARWRLASISKQIVATMLMQDVAKGRFTLDQPLGGLMPQLGALTLRQLLTHHSGLANPDDTPKAAGGMPAFYTAAKPDPGYCLSRPPQPGSAFSYNNCDYMVASIFLMGRLGDEDFWPAGMDLAKDSDRLVPGFVGGKPEPMVRLINFGASGALTGTARGVFDFDRALMTGKLLPPAARAELWKPEGGGSYQALGQWVFPGQLKGCAAPKRIVQRDGEIGGVQTRNYILPDDDLVVVVFTNRSSDDFPIGEIWQGKGFAFDLLSAAACP